MIYVLIFHWFRDLFTSQHLSKGRFICYLSHTCKHSWPAQMMFSEISNFLLHCNVPYVFWQSTLIDESKIYLLSFPYHQRLPWPTDGANEPCSTSNICSLYFLFLSRSFISYDLVSSGLPYHWLIGLNTLVSKNAHCPEI